MKPQLHWRIPPKPSMKRLVAEVLMGAQSEHVGWIEDNAPWHPRYRLPGAKLNLRRATSRPLAKPLSGSSTRYKNGSRNCLSAPAPKAASAIWSPR